jgi:universal stress protein A
MAKRILLPLDRSHAAECVVPLVADAARGSEAAVRLLHVAPAPTGWGDEAGRIFVYADQEMQRLEADGLDYLRAVETQFDDTPVECVVRFGDPVTEILAEAEAFEADLIAVSTAGRSGVGRVILGSVVEQVFGKAKASVVLLRPEHAMSD